MRRPYNDSIIALSASPSPCGSIVGGGAGDRDVKFFVFVCGEGPDCALKTISRFFLQRSRAQL
jgi:hypothetical protein